MEHKEGAGNGNGNGNANNRNEDGGIKLPTYCKQDFVEANPDSKKGDFADAMLRCRKVYGVTPVKPMVFDMVKTQLGLPDGACIWTDANPAKWGTYRFRRGRGDVVRSSQGPLRSKRQKFRRRFGCAYYDTATQDFYKSSCDNECYLACDDCDNTDLLELYSSPVEISVELTFDTDVDMDLAALDWQDSCETWYQETCLFNTEEGLVIGGEDRWGGDGNLGETITFQGEFGDGMENTPFLIAVLNYNQE